MEGLFVLLFQLLLFVGPILICGLIIGRTVEKRHFRNLEEREAANRGVVFVSQIKSFPYADNNGREPALVMAEAVIGSDYLKSWLASWRNIFGGEVRSFQTLQERGKREVILRLIEKAKQQGYNAVCNVRISAADVGGNTAGGKNKVPMAAVIATGTAYQASLSKA